MEGKKARSTLPALVRESYEGRKIQLFFYRDDDFNELRSEGESGFEIADPRFTWWTTEDDVQHDIWIYDVHEVNSRPSSQ